MAQCLIFFGLREGQRNFLAELHQLTAADKKDIFDGFKKLGLECDPPVIK